MYIIAIKQNEEGLSMNPAITFLSRLASHMAVEIEFLTEDIADFQEEVAELSIFFIW